ncbi:agamous-like MADS-box protein AGL80 [Fagus crenata]
MGRKKVKHELISNEYVRRTTFKKRKARLLKKLSELTTLCGIMTCGIIYSSYDPQPDVWPCPQEACRMLERFKNLPAKKQGKYMMDQKDFWRNLKYDNYRNANKTLATINLSPLETV